MENCPFCGKKPKILKRKKGVCKYAIVCPTPGCFFWVGEPKHIDLKNLSDYVTCYRKKKDLLEAWNKRSNKNKNNIPVDLELGKK